PSNAPAHWQARVVLPKPLGARSSARRTSPRRWNHSSRRGRSSSPRGMGGLLIFAGISGSGAGMAAFIFDVSLRPLLLSHPDLALHASGGQPADNPLLAIEEHQGDRQPRKHRRGGKVAPQVVLVVKVLLGAHRQREL